MWLTGRWKWKGKALCAFPPRTDVRFSVSMVTRLTRSPWIGAGLLQEMQLGILRVCACVTVNVRWKKESGEWGKLCWSYVLLCFVLSSFLSFTHISLSFFFHFNWLNHVSLFQYPVLFSSLPPFIFFLYVLLQSPISFLLFHLASFLFAASSFPSVFSDSPCVSHPFVSFLLILLSSPFVLFFSVFYSRSCLRSCPLVFISSTFSPSCPVYFVYFPSNMFNSSQPES